MAGRRLPGPLYTRGNNTAPTVTSGSSQGRRPFRSLILPKQQLQIEEQIELIREPLLNSLMRYGKRVFLASFWRVQVVISPRLSRLQASQGPRCSAVRYATALYGGSCKGGHACIALSRMTATCLALESARVYILYTHCVRVRVLLLVELSTYISTEHRSGRNIDRPAAFCAACTRTTIGSQARKSQRTQESEGTHVRARGTRAIHVRWWPESIHAPESRHLLRSRRIRCTVRVQCSITAGVHIYKYEGTYKLTCVPGTLVQAPGSGHHIYDQ